MQYGHLLFQLAYFSDLMKCFFGSFDGRSECFDELIHIIRPHKDKSAKILEIS